MFLYQMSFICQNTLMDYVKLTMGYVKLRVILASRVRAAGLLRENQASPAIK
jgi:hypothetical protein